MNNNERNRSRAQGVKARTEEHSGEGRASLDNVPCPCLATHGRAACLLTDVLMPQVSLLYLASCISSFLPLLPRSSPLSPLLFVSLYDIGVCELGGQRVEELHILSHFDLRAVGQALLCVTDCFVEALIESAEEAARPLAVPPVRGRRSGSGVESGEGKGRRRGGGERGEESIYLGLDVFRESVHHPAQLVHVVLVDYEGSKEVAYRKRDGAVRRNAAQEWGERSEEDASYLREHRIVV